MILNRRLVIKPLSSQHNRSEFFSGNDMLDNYLKRQASQDVKRYVCRVFVLTEADSLEAILGFYTLSASAIKINELPETEMRKLPRHLYPPL